MKASDTITKYTMHGKIIDALMAATSPTFRIYRGLTCDVVVMTNEILEHYSRKLKFLNVTPRTYVHIDHGIDTD